jgi:hypothetical protein
LAIPTDSKLARNQAQKDEKELEEQKEIKRLVLQYAQAENEAEETDNKKVRNPPVPSSKLSVTINSVTHII